jgi:acyl carrier protein
MWGKGDQGNRAERRPLPGNVSVTTQGPPPTAEQIRAWLVRKLAVILEVRPETIDPSAPFDQFGLDSVAAVDLTAAIEKWLRREFSPSLAYEYPSVDALANYLAGALAAAA